MSILPPKGGSVGGVSASTKSHKQTLPGALAVKPVCEPYQNRPGLSLPKDHGWLHSNHRANLNFISLRSELARTLRDPILKLAVD